MGLTELAEDNYKLALEKEPDNTEYYKIYKEFESTLPKEEEKVTSSTDSAAQTKTTEAAENLQNQTLENGNYDELIKKGNEYYQSGKYNEAVDCYTKATIIKPSDSLTMLKIGNIYNLLGNEERAALFYEHAVEVNPEYANGWFNLGLIYLKMKRDKDSIKCFETVIKLTPDYPYCYYALGEAYENIGDKFNAIENYTLYKGFEDDERMLETIDEKIKKLEE